MATRPVLLDTTRLLTRLRHPTPTGIDRVELAYARHFLSGPADGQAVAATMVGVRLLPTSRRDALLETVSKRWTDTEPADSDPAYARLRDRLAGTAPAPQPGGTPAAPSLAARIRQLAAEPSRSASAIGWAGVETAPRDAVYLHTSHIRLDRPHLFEWLDRRPDVKAVFFIHDLIPIDYPEYGVPGEEARHRVRIDNVARRAAALVANSEDVKDRLSRYLSASGLPKPPIRVAANGVEPGFTAGGVTPFDPGRPYFVVCGTIEARKNHLLLLQLWREMERDLGPATPALVVVGRRGWESENVVDLLERCPAVRRHVVEVGGLSNPALIEVVAGARALLMPSFAEGYGMPVAEALSLGTPVIASDLPSHREIAGGTATLLDPLDGPGWRAAIHRAATMRPAAAAGFRPPLWSEHFATVEALLDNL
jgi:glycosyltransferase involved in cell wall biosynthesis